MIVVHREEEPERALPLQHQAEELQFHLLALLIDERDSDALLGGRAEVGS